MVALTDACAPILLCWPCAWSSDTAVLTGSTAVPTRRLTRLVGTSDRWAEAPVGLDSGPAGVTSDSRMWHCYDSSHSPIRPKADAAAQFTCFTDQ
jgi:hypothetical protein